MSKVIGIDLGTTNSCVAIMEENKPKIIENSEGGRTTPSVFAITKTYERLIGQVAKRQAITNPVNTIFSIKRLMGQQYDEVIRKNKKVSYQLFCNHNGDAWVSLGKELYSPQEISAQILQKIKKTAERYIGEPVVGAVITVPAYFNDAQRQATKDAGTIAGMNVLRIINEPTAAALAYGLDQADSTTIAVYDLGGGTFDISILEVGKGLVEVLSTNGDPHLGGDDFDQAIIESLTEEFEINCGASLYDDPIATQRLREAAEKAKCELSSSLTAEINLPFIAASKNGAKHLNVSLSRSKLEKLTANLIERLIPPCYQALKDAGLKANEVDEVILVGGQTRMPKVQELVKQIFGKEARRGVNPDEVVAIGASVQGAVLSGDPRVKEILLLDVTPLSLGIEISGGAFTRLINRNTTIPAQQSKTFTTAEDNQSSVDIHVLQGESQEAALNKTIGRFRLGGLPPVPRNETQIDVSFEIDVNGILSVSARDLATNNQRQISITNTSGLLYQEVQRMARKTATNSINDELRREEATIRYKAENLIYETEKELSVQGEKIDPLVKSEIEFTKTVLQQTIEQRLRPDEKLNIERIDTQMDSLLQIWQKLPTDFYEKYKLNQQSANFKGNNYNSIYGTANTANAKSVEDSAKNGEQVIDVDYEIIF